MELSLSQLQFLSWLKAREPRAFQVVKNKIARPTPRGVAGLGDTTSSGSTWDSILGAVNSITTGVTSIAQDKALVSYNLQRAQQGLSPVSSLPATPTTTTAAPSSFLGLSPLMWGGAALAVAGLAWAVFGGKKSKA